MKGKFIVLEGLDGAGIATQATLLAHRLKNAGFSVLLTKEPTNGLIGGISKAALRGEFKISPRTLQLLFCADRAHHLEKEIEPALARGKFVICDRYLFSTLSYGYASNVNYKWLRYINLNFRLPDIGILLDVKPNVSMVRVSDAEDGLQLFEDREKLNRVRQAYLNIAKEFHLKKIDGDSKIDDVSDKVYNLINKGLGGHQK
jgi:dTMP kinase